MLRGVRFWFSGSVIFLGVLFNFLPIRLFTNIERIRENVVHKSNIVQLNYQVCAATTLYFIMHIEIYKSTFRFFSLLQTYFISLAMIFIHFLCCSHSVRFYPRHSILARVFLASIRSSLLGLNKATFLIHRCFRINSLPQWQILYIHTWF